MLFVVIVGSTEPQFLTGNKALAYSRSMHTSSAVRMGGKQVSQSIFRRTCSYCFPTTGKFPLFLVFPNLLPRNKADKGDQPLNHRAELWTSAPITTETANRPLADSPAELQKKKRLGLFQPYPAIHSPRLKWISELISFDLLAMNNKKWFVRFQVPKTARHGSLIQPLSENNNGCC